MTVPPEPIEPPPEPGVASRATMMTVAALSALPVAGGPVAELLRASLQPVVERRYFDWLNDLAKRVNELAERSDTWSLDRLAENDLFIDALMTAVQAAIRTSREEKLTALRNTVLNAASPGLVSEHEVLVLIRLIDELTPLHLAVLKIGAAPEEWYRRTSVNGRRDAIERALPETRTEEDLAGRLLGDLDGAHLLSIENADAERSGHQTWLNPLGERFMRFISNPIESRAGDVGDTP